MKKLLMILLAAGLVSAASAQHVHVGGGYYGGGYRGGVVVGAYSPGIYWGFGYPFWGNPWGYPNGYGYGHAPTKLQSQISDIKADYADRITSVKADNTLSGKEKRQQVRALKHQRDDAVANAARSYWRTPVPNQPAPAQPAPSQPAPTNGN
jgi:hypothetical protein